MKNFYADTATRSVVDLTEYGETGKRPTGLIITRINVPKEHRRQGIGTKLMKEICQEADDTGTILWLEVASYNDGGPNNDQLYDWYEKFGFKGAMSPLRRLPQKLAAKAYIREVSICEVYPNDTLLCMLHLTIAGKLFTRGPEDILVCYDFCDDVLGLSSTDFAERTRDSGRHEWYVRKD